MEPSAIEPAAPRVIVMIRHGEKVGDDGDAALSDTGRARAVCLDRVLADLGVTHVFHTELQRTRDTVAAVAARHHLTPTVIRVADEATWVDSLRALPPGAVAVVAGHSNTVPTLVERLGAGTAPIDHAEFDWMFTIVLPDRGDALLLRTHYCPASPTGALEKPATHP